VTRRRSTGWRVERATGSAAALLEAWPTAETEDGPAVRCGRVTGRAALVLGSTQDIAVVDVRRAAHAGVDVVRRSTGGGAVLVAPDSQVWLDVWVPRLDDLWDDDIVRAATWVGETWVAALGSLGAGALEVHRAPATRDAWSDLICFAGLGPGEVHIGGAKVMGLAQRRTRAGARFHTTAPLRWDPASLLGVLDRGGAVGEASLEGAAVGVRALLTAMDPGADATGVIAAVENAVIDALP
jgi:lipoate-protein ligase A